MSKDLPIIIAGGGIGGLATALALGRKGIPVRVIEHMRMIIDKVEAKGYNYNRLHLPYVSSETFISDSVCYNACVMASQVGAKAIVGITRSGYTAYKVSSQRPNAAIYVFTDRKEMLNTLSLVWGVRAIYYDHAVSTDHTIKELQQLLKELGFVQKGDLVINLASIPLEDQGRTNMIKLGKVT